MAKNAATGIGANVVSQVLGLGQIGQTVTHYGAQLLTLKFSRGDESEADLVGMELAASKGAPPQWLSTHPSGNTRLSDIERNLPKVMALYERAKP